MNKTTENRLGGELRSQQAARRLLEELQVGEQIATPRQDAMQTPPSCPASWSWPMFWA